MSVSVSTANFGNSSCPETSKTLVCCNIRQMLTFITRVCAGPARGLGYGNLGCLELPDGVVTVTESEGGEFPEGTHFPRS